MLGLVAGSETTASVMRITLLCLISSPPVYQKLKAVVKEAVSRGAVTEPISYSVAKEIPYLKVSHLSLMIIITKCPSDLTNSK